MSVASDHCHETSFPRALLCRACNSAIGLLGEDVERIDAAAAYVRRFREVRVKFVFRNRVECAAVARAFGDREDAKFIAGGKLLTRLGITIS